MRLGDKVKVIFYCQFVGEGEIDAILVDFRIVKGTKYEYTLQSDYFPTTTEIFFPNGFSMPDCESPRMLTFSSLRSGTESDRDKHFSIK